MKNEKINIGKIYYTIHLDDGKSLSDEMVGYRYVSPHGTYVHIVSARQALHRRIKSIIDVIEIGNIFYFAKNVTKVTIDKEDNHYV